jgi:hypothetical protein
MTKNVIPKDHHSLTRNFLRLWQARTRQLFKYFCFKENIGNEVSEPEI